MFEIPTLINHLSEALVKAEAVAYDLQFSVPHEGSEVVTHRLREAAEETCKEIRAALKIAQELEHARKYGE